MADVTRNLGDVDVLGLVSVKLVLLQRALGLCHELPAVASGEGTPSLLRECLQ